MPLAATTLRPVLSHMLDGAFIPVMDVSSIAQREAIHDVNGFLIEREACVVEGQLRGGHALAEGLPTWLRIGDEATWRLELEHEDMQFGVSDVQVSAAADLVKLVLIINTPVIKTWREK